VHSHSPTVIPFSITQTELRPVFHRASFLSSGVPVFEIRAVAGAKNNMLVNDAKRGKAWREERCADARPRQRGGPINYLSAKEAESLEVDLARTKPSDARGADRVWEGLKRLVQSGRAMNKE
jgi:hypothetical protein